MNDFTRKRCDYDDWPLSSGFCEATAVYVKRAYVSRSIADVFVCERHSKLYPKGSLVPIEEYEVKCIEDMLCKN